MVIGYVRVSTREQGESGAGLAAQRDAIRGACARADLGPVRWCEDVASTGGPRPQLEAALDLLARGEATALVAAKLDRLSRSLVDFVRIAEAARSGGWALLVLDAPVDTSTAAGEAMLGILAVFAQLERRMIRERTRAALAAMRADGRYPGPRSRIPAPVHARIRAEDRAGLSLAAIARGLNADGVPTVAGGREWHRSTVRAALHAVNI